MSTPLVDRFHFAARGLTKTPIVAEAPNPKTADGVAVLRLYDPIDRDGGPWGVSAREFAAVLDGLDDDVQTIELHISSPGGMVWDALAIMNSLRQHPARVVAIIDGIAASAASFIMLAGDEVVAAQGAEVMVHSPMGVAIGNAEDMAKMASDLEHEARNMAALYVAKAGGTVEDWLAVMATETWYTAEEAVAAGLVDRVLDTKPADDQAKARFDLGVFAYAGRAKAPAPTSPGASASGRAAAGGTTLKETAVADTLTDGLRQRLGIADDADEATILAALDEALAEQVAPAPPTEVLAPAALAEVTRLSTELAELKAQASARTKDEHFASWLREGKTSPAERAQLGAMYDAAPAQTVALVGARAKGSVVPVDVIGDGEDPESTDDAFYASLFPTEKVG